MRRSHWTSTVKSLMLQDLPEVLCSRKTCERNLISALNWYGGETKERNKTLMSYLLYINTSVIKLKTPTNNPGCMFKTKQILSEQPSWYVQTKCSKSIKAIGSRSFSMSASVSWQGDHWRCILGSGGIRIKLKSKQLHGNEL